MKSLICFFFKMTAFLGGLIYFQTGTRENGSCSIEQRGIINISFALFYTITTSVLFSILAAVMVIDNNIPGRYYFSKHFNYLLLKKAFPLELPIYNREHSASVYRSDTYYISKLFNEVSCTFLQNRDY